MGKNYRGQTARLIWNTLTTPITEFSDDFALANLKNDLKMHEMEFYFPFEYSKNFEIPEEIKHSDGFLTGFIDMVFCYKGLYFIVDWESNNTLVF